MWWSSSFCLMTAVVVLFSLPPVHHLSARAVSPARLSGEGSPGDADRRGRDDPSQREAYLHGRRGFDLRAGAGERQPGVVYDTETPLFDFDVLVTGYEPFLSYSVNPAHEVATSLNGTCDTVFLSHPYTMRICYEGVGLPVTPAGSRWTADTYWESPDRWDGVLHLGFESMAKGLRLETIAANVRGSEEFGYMMNADVPCSKEGTPFRYIHEGSPCVLPTTAPLSHLDLGGLTELLEDSGHGHLVSLETWSRDAGAYYCNDQFYRTLHAIRMEAPVVNKKVTSLTPAMFVHLPHVTVVDREDMSVMVRYIAQSIMAGTIGLLPESCQTGQC